MYAKLQVNLTQKIEELGRFNKKYPNITVHRMFPEDIVTQVFNQVHSAHNKTHLDNMAYLLSDEREGIDVGSEHSELTAFKVGAIEKQFSSAVHELQTDLDDLLISYLIRLKVLLMRNSEHTAPYRAKLLDRKYTLSLEIDQAKKAIADYYIKQCSRPSAAKNLHFSFYTDKKSVPEVLGVYFLCYNGEIIYVGHSTNLHNRLNNHDIVRKYYCRDDFECVISFLRDVDETKALENKLIPLLRPKENKNLKE